MKKNKETKFVDTWENYKKLKDNLISNRCTGIIYFHKSNDYIWEHIKKIIEDAIIVLFAKVWEAVAKDKTLKEEKH